MLLAPLIEAPAAAASHLPQRLASIQRVITTQSRHLYSSGTPVKPFGHRVLEKVLQTKQSRTNGTVHTGNKRILVPYDLSQRLDALCQKRELPAAISLVKSSPLDAQNVIVWATLIRSVLADGRYKEAYRLFTDMKRRGIKPTSRTFSTLLKGYAQIEDWEKYPLQLDNVSNIYTQLMQYHATVGETGDPREELSNIPYNLLISIFGKAQRFQRMFDVFNAMPAKGPLAPDIRTFTFLINAIGNRQLSAISKTPTEGDEENSSPPTANELAYKNAADARLIWRQLLRVSPNPDSHAIRAILKPLSRGRPSDQTLAFDIAHEYLGLSRPGEQSITAKLDLHPQTLESLLIVSNVAKRYRYTLNYIQQVIDSGCHTLLTRRHMDYVLQAHAALACVDPGEAGQALETLQWMLRMQALPQAPRLDGGVGPQIRPATTTYDIVALACWNGGDWSSACRAFELMTGYSSDQFRGEMSNPPENPPLLTREPRLRPSAIFMSSFIRAAAKTNDSGNIRQALNVLDHCGVDTVLEEATRAEQSPRETLQKRENNRLFHAYKLVEALRMVLRRVLVSPDYDQSTKTRWKDMMRRAEQVVPGKPVPDDTLDGKRQSGS